MNMKYIISVLTVLILLISCGRVEEKKKEMVIRSDLTEKIIEIYPIPFVDYGTWSQIGMGFKFVYCSVQDAIAGHNVDSVYNIIEPNYGSWNANDRIAGREYMKSRAAREEQLRVKPNPGYVANGLTAVLEIYVKEHSRSRIHNELGYILVNDKKELKTIEDNIRNIGTIIVLMRYIANSETYSASAMGRSKYTTLNQEGMAVYFYDCKNGVVFDNFTVLADDLPKKFAYHRGDNFVTTHVDIINSKLKTSLTGQLSFDKILRE
jgi:hypothetical protein